MLRRDQHYVPLGLPLRPRTRPGAVGGNSNAVRRSGAWRLVASRGLRALGVAASVTGVGVGASGKAVESVYAKAPCEKTCSAWYSPLKQRYPYGLCTRRACGRCERTPQTILLGRTPGSSLNPEVDVALAHRTARLYRGAELGRGNSLGHYARPH